MYGGWQRTARWMTERSGVFDTPQTPCLKGFVGERGRYLMYFVSFFWYNTSV